MSEGTATSTSRISIARRGLSQIDWRDWGTLLIAVLAVHTAGFFAWYMLSDQSSPSWILLENLAFVPVGIIATVLAFRASTKPTLDSRSRKGWRLLALAFSCWWLGDVAWLYYEGILAQPPSPSLADVPYLLGYPLLLAGLLSFPKFTGGRAESTIFWLDVVIVFLGSGIVSWYLFLSPVMHSAEGPLVTLVGLAYPLGDLALFGGIAVAIMSRQVEHRKAVAKCLLLGLGLTLGLDLLFSAQLIQGLYGKVEWPSWLDMIIWWLLAMAGFLQFRQPESRRSTHATGALFPWLPYASIAIGYGVMLLQSYVGNREPLTGGLVLAAALTTAVLIRMAVSEQLRLRRAADRSEERFRSLVQNASDVIAVVDADTTIRYQTPSVEGVLGHAPEALIGKRLVSIAHPKEAADLAAFVARATSDSASSDRGEWRFRRPDGSWSSTEILATNLIQEPSIGGVVLTIRNVDERKAFEEQLTHMAFRDSLTGLPNRALFLDRLEQALDGVRRHSEPVAVALLDLDDFKTINDSLGHSMGDEVLVEVARRLEGSLRSTDTIARLGGDEFALILPGADEEQAWDPLARRTLRAIEIPMALDGRRFSLTGSIGLVATTTGRESAGDLLRSADAAMYTAKSRGKGTVELFEPGMHTAMLERFELDSQLQQAIARNQFVLHYQPILELSSRRIVSAEALIRWDCPGRGLVAPGAFIPLAEETGHIVEIGGWVLREACRQAAAWAEDSSLGPAPDISINLSSRQLQHPQIVEQVSESVRSAGLDPRRLILEITESLLVEEWQATAARLEELKALGARIAIDDFGTGFSALSYIQNLPVDIIKIDRSFISRVAAEAKAPSLVRGIVELARTMRLETVAEGIERTDQLEALESVDCALGQGFLFARPLAEDKFGEFLSSGPPDAYERRELKAS